VPASDRVPERASVSESAWLAVPLRALSPVPDRETDSQLVPQGHAQAYRRQRNDAKGPKPRGQNDPRMPHLEQRKPVQDRVELADTVDDAWTWPPRTLPGVSKGAKQQREHLQQFTS